MNERTFREILGYYPTGVCVITALNTGGRLIGMTVGSFTSVSLDPPLIGFLPSKRSETWPAIAAAGRFVVNILAADQEALCRRFAAKWADRAEGTSFRLSANGQPVLEGTVAWIAASLAGELEAGDHLFVLGQPQEFGVGIEAPPLIFNRGRLLNPQCFELRRSTAC